MQKYGENYTTIFTKSLDMTIRGIHVTTEHEMVCCQNWKELGYTPSIGWAGLYEIKGLDSKGTEHIGDEVAVINAVKDGFRVIPVHELPEDMPVRRFSFIDCQYNRDQIARLYGKKEVTEATDVMPLKEFYVDVWFKGKIVYNVKAHTADDAIHIADKLAEDVDLGPLEDIEWTTMPPVEW